jgi:hypothetical protein
MYRSSGSKTNEYENVDLLRVRAKAKTYFCEAIVKCTIIFGHVGLEEDHPHLIAAQRSAIV